MMYEQKRLHLWAILFQSVKTLKDFFFGLLPLFILVIRDYLFYSILGFCIIIILTLGYSILTWFRYTYTLTDDQIKIESGVFIRKKRTISKHRIQSIHLSQTIIHRFFDLTSVQIETAGSDMKVDAKLSAVMMREGEKIRQQLKPKGGQPTKTEQESSAPDEVNEKAYSYDYDYIIEQKYPKYELNFKQLFIYGSTSGSFGAILGLLFVFGIQIEVFIPERIYQSTTAWLFAQAIGTILILSLIILLITWFLGVFSKVIRYGDFTIVRFDEELFITRGLFEKKQLSIPLKRIQAVGIKQNLLRQPFGLSTIYVEVAGGDVEKDGTKTILLPLIHKKNWHDFFTQILPEYQLDLTELNHAPKRALPYYLIKSSLSPLIAFILTAIFAQSWLLLFGIIFVLAFGFGWHAYKNAASKISQQQLTLQMWLFGRETILLKHQRIQAIEKKQHFIERKLKLATIQASILDNFVGKHYAVNKLEQEDVDEIADWYSYRKNN